MTFLDPCNDVAFKKIFGSDKHKSVTISFLNSILELTGDKAIKEVDFLNTEQTPLAGDKKRNILDIFCTDQANNRYIVEMQVKKVKEFDKRMVYYGAKTYALQLEKNRSYRELMPVVVVALVDFVMFPGKASYKSIHQILDNKTHEHDITELSFAFVELPKFTKKEHELVTHEEKWLYFIKEIDEQQSIPQSLSQGAFEEACHTAERMTWSESELNAYDDELVRLTDDIGALELAQEKGRQDERYQTACRLLEKGCDPTLIAHATDLSLEQVKEIASKKS